MIASRRYLPVLVLVLCAASYTSFVLFARAEQGLGLASVDTHSYFVPNALYAWRSILAGSGWLWNPFQNCGQPFLAISSTGTLYPAQILFLWLDVGPALLATLILHLSLAGIGAYLLARELRLDPPAALCAALAFQLGTQSLKLASWSPIHLAAFAWLPVVMWRAERALRTPGPRNAAALGIVLALQILPGFPQLVFLGCQLVALRTLFVLLVAGRGARMARMATIAGGVLLGMMLAAVQLLPSVELASESVRAGPLSRSEIGEGFEWATVLPGIFHWPYPLALPLVVVLCGAGASSARTRVHSLFFLGVAALYLVLCFGPGTVLFDLYAQLPLGGRFRQPERFVWCVDLALALAAGYGAQAVLTASGGRIGLPVAATAAGLLHLLASRRGDLESAPAADLDLIVWVLAGAGLVLVLVGARAPRHTRTVCAGLSGLLLVSGFAAGSRPYLGYRTNIDYAAREASFSVARDALTAQDRVFLVGSVRNFGLMPKSASLYRMPAIGDFEPQTSRAWAEYTAYMQTGRPLRRIEQAYTVSALRLVGEGFNRPLLDLTAARFVLAERRLERALAEALPDLVVRHRGPFVTVYENPSALPRAFFVDRLQVLPNEEILGALASGADPRVSAFVSAPPRSGFTGGAGDARASVRIGRDLPEWVIVRVQSERSGFLFLADQYAPGWRARVDGRDVEILRANHAFRVVEVPAGRSEVEFRYRPTNLYVGGTLSGAGVLVLVGLLRVGRRRPEGTVEGAPGAR